MSESSMAGYELWDTESRNLLDDFGSEAEAVEAVRALIRLNGLDTINALALTRVDLNGCMSTLAMGADLARLVEVASVERQRRPA